MSDKYGLEPHTICLFDKTFRMFQRENFAEFLQDGHGQVAMSESSWLSFSNKIYFMNINACVSLRLVMKFSESQARLYDRSMLSESGATVS